MRAVKLEHRTNVRWALFMGPSDAIKENCTTLHCCRPSSGIWARVHKSFLGWRVSQEHAPANYDREYNNIEGNRQTKNSSYKRKIREFYPGLFFFNAGFLWDVWNANKFFFVLVHRGCCGETEIKSTSATPFLYVMQQEIKKGIHDNAKINKRMKHEMCY